MRPAVSLSMAETVEMKRSGGGEVTTGVVAPGGGAEDGGIVRTDAAVEGPPQDASVTRVEARSTRVRVCTP